MSNMTTGHLLAKNIHKQIKITDCLCAGSKKGKEKRSEVL